MKRMLISCIAVITVLTTVYVVFGQPQEERRQRWAQRRQMQREAIEAILQQANKLKTQMDEAESQREGRPDFQSMSEEERTQLRERFRQRREEQQACLEAIEIEIAKIKGPRRLGQEHEESLSKLEELHAMALKENATQTAEAIRKIINSKKQEFEQLQQKLGFEQQG